LQDWGIEECSEGAGLRNKDLVCSRGAELEDKNVDLEDVAGAQD
jgi:hypothetical protein